MLEMPQFGSLGVLVSDGKAKETNEAWLIRHVRGRGGSDWRYRGRILATRGSHY
jgi:hypothetical protein